MSQLIGSAPYRKPIPSKAAQIASIIAAIAVPEGAGAFLSAPYIHAQREAEREAARQLAETDRMLRIAQIETERRRSETPLEVARLEAEIRERQSRADADRALQRGLSEESERFLLGIGKPDRTAESLSAHLKDLNQRRQVAGLAPLDIAPLTESLDQRLAEAEIALKEATAARTRQTTPEFSDPDARWIGTLIERYANMRGDDRYTAEALGSFRAYVNQVLLAKGLPAIPDEQLPEAASAKQKLTSSTAELKLEEAKSEASRRDELRARVGLIKAQELSTLEDIKIARERLDVAKRSLSLRARSEEISLSKADWAALDKLSGDYAELSGFYSKQAMQYEMAAGKRSIDPLTGRALFEFDDGTRKVLLDAARDSRNLANEYQDRNRVLVEKRAQRVGAGKLPSYPEPGGQRRPTPPGSGYKVIR